MILAPLDNFRASVFRSEPSINKEQVYSWYFNNSFKTPKVWSDNSRDGVIIMHPVPAIHLIIEYN